MLSTQARAQWTSTWARSTRNFRYPIGCKLYGKRQLSDLYPYCEPANFCPKDCHPTTSLFWGTQSLCCFILCLPGDRATQGSFLYISGLEENGAEAILLFTYTLIVICHLIIILIDQILQILCFGLKLLGLIYFFLTQIISLIQKCHTVFI